MSGEYHVFSLFYDELIGDDEQNARADYVISLLKQYAKDGGILLDLACGTGKITRKAKEAGYDCIGVDISPEMLNIARENSEDNEILYLCQDMSELDLFGTIDACICTLDSLNHLIEDEDFVAAVEKVALFINPGGIFIFDVNTEYKHRNILANNTFIFETDNVFCVWQNDTDEKLITEINLDFFKNDGNDNYIRYFENFFERAYSEEFIKNTLNNAGFEIVHIFEELTQNPVKEDTERAFFVCRRKEWQLQ
jgi:SAM-dependent methyltransferase